MFEMKLLNKLSYQIFKMRINIYRLDITWNMHKPVEKSCGTDFLLGIYSVVDWPYIWEWKEALGLWEGRQWEKLLRKGPALILAMQPRYPLKCTEHPSQRALPAADTFEYSWVHSHCFQTKCLHAQSMCAKAVQLIFQKAHPVGLCSLAS